MAKLKEPVGERDQIAEILDSKEYREAKGVYGYSDINKILHPEVITTSSVGLDIFLNGGYRAGWSKWQGDFESGKTSMALCWGKNWIEKFPDEGMIIYFNAEGRLDKARLLNSGIDPDEKRFKSLDINNGDKLFDLMEELIWTNPEGRKYFFIIDSIDALEREVDSDKRHSEGEKVGGGGLLTSIAGKRLSLPMGKSGHHLFLISQLRAKINTGGRGMGPQKQGSGGNAPKFYSSLAGDIQNLWTDLIITENPSDPKSKRIGHLQTIKFIKTFNQKTGQVVQIPIKNGLQGGIWRAYEAMMLGMMWNMIAKSGAWYNLSEEFAQEISEQKISFPTKLQGEKSLREALDSNPDFVDYTLNKIKQVAI